MAGHDSTSTVENMKNLVEERFTDDDTDADKEDDKDKDADDDIGIEVLN
jgi:hypothetical protein